MLKEHFNNPQLADLKITVQGTEFHCHAQLLSIVSPYFQALLKPEWRPEHLQLQLPNGLSLTAFQSLLELIYQVHKAKASDPKMESLDVISLIELSQLANHYLIASLHAKINKLV